MEKNKLIIQSIIQGKLTPAQAAEHFGVSRRWVYELMRRHRVLGEDGGTSIVQAPSFQSTTDRGNRAFTDLVAAS